MSDGCIFLWFKASIWVVFVTGKLDFSAGSEWEKDCKNQPVKAIFLHVTFSLRWKNAYRGKKKKREEHVFLPFKERLCYLSSKLGIEQPFFLNREFSTVVYFLKKTCFLQVMYMVLTVVALQVTNWSPSTTWFAINKSNISESHEYLFEKPTPKDAKIPI